MRRVPAPFWISPSSSSSAAASRRRRNNVSPVLLASILASTRRFFGAKEASGWEPPKGPSVESGPRWTQTIPNQEINDEAALATKGDELIDLDKVHHREYTGNPEGDEAGDYLGEVHEIGTNGHLAAVMAWNQAQSNQIRAGAGFNQIETVDPKDGKVKVPSRGTRPGRNSGLYRKWDDEPAIEDLDLSIPQVNCAFVADLLAKRKKEQAQQWGDIDPERRKKNIAEKKEERDRERTEKGEKARKANFEDENKEENEADLEDPLDYDEVRNLALHPSDGITMIDVRTVAEVSSWGTIEGAKILPMHEFWEAFHLAPEEFEEQYGFELPDKNTTLLFFCHHGPRSLMAAQVAHHLGYTNVVHLKEGFYEWSKQYFLLCRRWMVHDHTTGINNQRLLEFETARSIAGDIAPEFNDIVEAETEMIRIDHSRSVGEKQLPIPDNVKQLSLEFDQRRDQLEISDSGNANKLNQPLLSGSKPAAATAATAAAADDKGDSRTSSTKLGNAALETESHAANERERKGLDPVLDNVPAISEEEFDAQAELLRRDYFSEAARVLRRRKASERTGIPESFMFRRKEQPHGTGR